VLPLFEALSRVGQPAAATPASGPAHRVLARRAPRPHRAPAPAHSSGAAPPAAAFGPGGGATAAAAGTGGGGAAVSLMAPAALLLLLTLSIRVSLDMSAWRSTLLSLRLERPG
jgi:3-oxoacyl-ACP reductase-like protein